mmetsp:Transcript_60858/g.100697  ORF Transcript_60858/g.100697 Transcript_60858/m.100697 type:complete len:149 (+) Transcript_60858:126-572(+)
MVVCCAQGPVAAGTLCRVLQPVLFSNALVHCIDGVQRACTPKAAKPRARPSPTSAAKPALQVAAQPAAGEPIPVALCVAEHVQLFRVKYLRQKKWHMEPIWSGAGHASRQAVPGSFCGSCALVSACRSDPPPGVHAGDQCSGDTEGAE